MLSKLQLHEAKRAQGVTERQLSKAARDIMGTKELYEEAMVEIERQANALTLLQVLLVSYWNPLGIIVTSVQDFTVFLPVP